MTLQPCPHCGKTEHDKDDSTGEHAVIATSYPQACVVQCNYCGLSGPLEDTVPLAIAAWNSLPRKAVTARQRIRDVRDIVTTDSETKEQLIARVRALLQE
jgi:hypothetical protein